VWLTEHPICAKSRILEAERQRLSCVEACAVFQTYLVNFGLQVPSIAVVYRQNSAVANMLGEDWPDFGILE
jgi:hypothetical protein